MLEAREELDKYVAQAGKLRQEVSPFILREKGPSSNAYVSVKEWGRLNRFIKKRLGEILGQRKKESGLSIRGINLA